MVKKNNEHKIDTAENMFGGSGKVSFKRIIETPEELYGKGRVFSVVTLEPGSELGWHVHKGDGEFYHIISGEGEYNDNGSIVTMRAGDTASTAQDTASRSITSRSRSRLRSVIRFESSSSGSLKSGGRITAAAKTGPARHPRPASSQPASRSSY